MEETGLYFNDECIDNILERISLDIGRNSRAGYDNSRKLYSSEYLSEPKIKVELRFQFLKFIKIKSLRQLIALKVSLRDINSKCNIKGKINNGFNRIELILHGQIHLNKHNQKTTFLPNLFLKFTICS